MSMLRIRGTSMKTRLHGQARPENVLPRPKTVTEHAPNASNHRQLGPSRTVARYPEYRSYCSRCADNRVPRKGKQALVRNGENRATLRCSGGADKPRGVGGATPNLAANPDQPPVAKRKQMNS